MSINNDHNIYLTYNHINKALSDQEKRNEKKAGIMIAAASVIATLAATALGFSLGVSAGTLILMIIVGSAVGTASGIFLGDGGSKFTDFQKHVKKMVQEGNSLQKVGSDDYNSFVKLVDKKTLASLYQPESPPPPYSDYSTLDKDTRVYI